MKHVKEILNQKELNAYAVQILDKYTRDIMAITGLDYQKSQKLIKLCRPDASRTAILASLTEVGVDISNRRLVNEFENYWSFADDDKE